MPTYNCANFIKPAIKSVLAQKYENYELLIIDDGSIDNTEEIITSIKDERINYIKNRKNIGIVKSLNSGIKKAKGTYIARIDADDLMLGNRLYEQINFLKTNPEYGMVGSWYQITNENGYILKTIEPPTDHDNLKWRLLFRNQFAHSALTIRTNIINQLLYDQNFIYCEDYELWCRVSEISRIACIPSYYLSYRWHENNSCHINQKKLKINMLKLLFRELEKYDITCSTKELAIHGALCFNYGNLFFEDKKKEINAWIDKIISKLPSEFWGKERNNIKSIIMNEFT